MYGFSEDEKHLLFMDGFGLTRLSRPAKVKTDVKISGSESAGLVTVSRDGSVAASFEDLWDKSVIWSFPELKPAKRFDRFRESKAIVHPEGTHYIVPDGRGLRLEPLIKRVLLPLRLDAPVDTKAAPAAAVTLDLSGGEELPALKLGEGRPDAPVPLRIAHDGTLLYFDGTTLICAALTGTTAKVRWRRAVNAPARARLELYADAQRCVLMLHHGRRWTVVVLDDAGLGAERSFEIESLGAPAVAGRYLAYQPSVDRVVRRELDTGEHSEHSLAIYDSKRKLDLSNEGVGTVFVGAKGSLLFLTAHRESVLDLIKGVEIARKLPAKDFEIRQALLGIARPYVDAARLAGITLELGRVELNPKYNSISITHRIAGGDNLLGALLASHSSAAWNEPALPGGWRMGSYGSHGGIGCDPGVTLDALVEAYTLLREHGISFASTIRFWAEQFDRHREPPRDAACLALLAQALVAVVRDGPATPLDYAALAERGRPTIDEVLAAYAHYPQRAKELEYTATKLAGGLFNRLYGPDAARIWTFTYLEAEGWEYHGTHYTDFASYGVEPLLDAHGEVAEVFAAWLRSHEIPEDDGRSYYLARLRERLGI
jgi:hypothetical protein